MIFIHIFFGVAETHYKMEKHKTNFSAMNKSEANYFWNKN